MARFRNTIKIIIILLILTTSLYLSIINYNSYNNNLKQIEELNNSITELKKEYDELEKNNNLLKTQIEEINNIPEKIKESKQIVFEAAANLEQKIQNGESDKKIAYLTFDDGPYYNSYQVLKVLKDKKVKATFFTTNANGQYCYDNKSVNCHDVYLAEANDNHTIANHTFTHAIRKGLYSSVDTFISNIVNQENLIYSKTGIKTNIVRFPGGSPTAGVLKNDMKQSLYNMGYGWVDWTAQDGDGGRLLDKNMAWNNFVNSINNNIEVVLFHDYNYITLSILPDAIDYLRNNGYILLPLFYDSVMVNKR